MPCAMLASVLFGLFFVAASGQGFYPADPANVPHDFVCAWRAAATDAVRALRPDATLEAASAAQLGTLCIENKFAQTALMSAENAVAAAAKITHNALHADAAALYVDAVHGADTNAGTIDAPLRTLSRGVVLSRALPRPASLVARAGTFYLNSTIELTAEDSGLTISVFPGEDAWVSGAVNSIVSPTWLPYIVTNASIDVQPGMNAARGCKANDPYNATCGCSPQPGLADCEAIFKSMPNATAFIYHDSTTGPSWSLQCCLRHDSVWEPYAEGGHTSGRRLPGLNIWVTHVANLTAMPELRVNRQRVPRARYPNADPETQQFPIGWVTTGTKTWHPPKPTKPITEVNVLNAELLTRNSTENRNYSGAIGGPCAVYDPPFSYWCSKNPAGGGGFQYYTPGGVTLVDSGLPSFTSPANNPAIFQVWRAAHWANWMFEIAAWDNASGVMDFGKGGFQGARGGPGSDWYVENALELLDAPSEWFFDPTTGSFYYFYNGTGAPPADTTFEVPMLETLLSINATQTAPAINISLVGLGFRDTAPTFMAPHAVPSAGDWALERIAAVHVEGTINLSVQSCNFSRVGGNGLMLSGFNRDATLTQNTFRWTGGTAMAAWGRTDEISGDGTHGWNATDGNFPWHTVVSGNLVTETGIWEKQSSCWFQAKTAQTVITGNVCFNLARAGFNFNDGLGGGDEVHNNVIFNSNRESADHGPINSWDRQPYVTLVYDGTPSARMLPRNISGNFLVGNYGGGNGVVDNDDGSLWFDNNHNFGVYGHQKFKVGAIRSFGNVLAYVTDFAGKWTAPGEQGNRPNGMWDNKVIFAPNVNATYHDCSPWYAHGNALYGPEVVVTGGSCKGRAYTVPEWQAQDPANNDVGCTINTTRPSANEIIAWARELLPWLPQP